MEREVDPEDWNDKVWTIDEMIENGGVPLATKNADDTLLSQKDCCSNGRLKKAF